MTYFKTPYKCLYAFLLLPDVLHHNYETITNYFNLCQHKNVGTLNSAFLKFLIHNCGLSRASVKVTGWVNVYSFFWR